MKEGRRVLVAGAVSIVAGLVVVFCSWFFFASVGCADPWPGCRNIPFDWHLGLVGMVLVTIGLGFLTYHFRGKMKNDKEETPVFISVMITFILFIIITAVVYNPLISPYDFIRDSDLDGYADDIDDFPDDKDRHMVTWLDVEVTWENTSTNYTARISSVYVYLDGEPTDTSVMRLVIRWLPYYYYENTEEIGVLADIEGRWVGGVRYQDNAPLGLFGMDDVFSFDKTVFDTRADALIVDDLGYEVAGFEITD